MRLQQLTILEIGVLHEAFDGKDDVFEHAGVSKWCQDFQHDTRFLRATGSAAGQNLEWAAKLANTAFLGRYSILITYQNSTHPATQLFSRVFIFLYP